MKQMPKICTFEALDMKVVNEGQWWQVQAVLGQKSCDVAIFAGPKRKTQRGAISAWTGVFSFLLSGCRPETIMVVDGHVIRHGERISR